ncbi:MAG: acyl-CoA carboxylase subunit beta [Acidimicrobiales bacterium]
MTPRIGTVLPTHIDTGDGEAQANRVAMLGMLEEVQAAQTQVLGGGGPKYVERHRGRGKLLVRERVELLVDRDAPFLELSPLAGWGTDDPLGGGTVVGIGVVEGVECLVTGSDPTVRGGSSSPTTVVKGLRAQEIAKRNRLPSVALTESGGADLPKQAAIFVPGGATFRNLTQLSAAGVPTVSVVFGSSTAGGAYQPGMSDYTVLVKDRARVYLGGPPLVKMAIDEDADEEELGGAEMHARTSGLADYLAADELDAIRIARGIIAHLNWRKLGPGPTLPPDEPVHDPEDLLAIVPADVRIPFDVREVLARVLDGSRFEDFKPLYGPQLVCGWGSIHGFAVGVLANNGILFSEEAQKGAQFIQLANQSDVPLVFVQNITGFMVGTRYEQGGIIKDGAKLINAVSNSTVPHLTLMIGASYGAGNYGMSGRAYDPRFVFTWPNHRIAVMGPKQLAGVMSMVGSGAPPEAIAALEAQVERESTALFATGQLWDDGIIDPRDSRTVLGLALSAAHSAPVAGTTAFGVFRM